MINSGEIRGLLGHNGAGKTTLVSIMVGLRRADSGTVTVLGRDVTSSPQTQDVVTRRMAPTVVEVRSGWRAPALNRDAERDDRRADQFGHGDER